MSWCVVKKENRRGRRSGRRSGINFGCGGVSRWFHHELGGCGGVSRSHSSVSALVGLSGCSPALLSRLSRFCSVRTWSGMTSKGTRARPKHLSRSGAAYETPRSSDDRSSCSGEQEQATDQSSARLILGKRRDRAYHTFIPAKLGVETRATRHDTLSQVAPCFVHVVQQESLHIGPGSGTA